MATRTIQDGTVGASFTLQYLEQHERQGQEQKWAGAHPLQAVSALSFLAPSVAPVKCRMSLFLTVCKP